jgi:predicted nucleotidyltransferase
MAPLVLGVAGAEGEGAGAGSAGEGAGAGAAVEEAEGLIGVPKAAFSRVMARLDGLRVGDRPVVDGVEVFGSRAGSTYRGRGPTAESDLDMLVSIDPAVLQGRNGRWVRDTLGKIRADFQEETNIELSLYAPDSVSTFKSSIPGTNFVRLR